MIYEVTTLDVLPHTVAEVEARLEATYPRRSAISALAGSFHTEIGPLNRIVQIWPYEDIETRDRAVATLGADGTWEADIAEFVVRRHSETFQSFACSPDVVHGSFGPWYEMRFYRHAAGDLKHIVAAWQAALPARLEVSPLISVSHSLAEGSDRLLHIWPYRTLDSRQDIRRAIRADGIWPPLAVARKRGMPTYDLLQMENMIVVPARFSPLQ